jgi:hypothetical protein
VSTGLPTLRHDDVDSGGDCSPGLFGAADRVQDDSVGIVDLLDVGAGIAPKQRHDPQTSFQGFVEATVLVGGENEIPAKGRSVSAIVSRTTSPAGADHANANMPSAPAFETAAASSGTADIGAWTIGCSMPSSSQTGVRTIPAFFLSSAGRIA